MRSQVVITFFSSLFIALAGCGNDAGQRNRQQQDTIQGDTVAQISLKKVKPVHPVYNDIARYIAGMPPAGPGGLDSSLRENKEWKQFAESFDKNWSTYDSTRLNVMREWRAQELKEMNASSKTLFYPFAGADFLNAYTFFPEADTFVLVGLEPVGTVPDFRVKAEAGKGNSKGKATDAEGTIEAGDDRNDYFRKINTSLHAILNFSFFRTKSMAVDFRNEEINGTIHLMLLFIARTGNSITDVMPVALKPNGEVVRYNSVEEAKADTATMNKGVEIEFLSADSSLKRAFYFSVNLADDMLNKNESFTSFVSRMHPFNTYLKSASYLMYNPYFSVVREKLILGGSKYVLEDDSGMPLRFFNPDAWDIRLYGTYDKPIPMFSMHAQPDLRKAFEDSSKVKPLPFGIGYDYKPGQSNLLLAKKKLGATHVPVDQKKSKDEGEAAAKPSSKAK